MGRWLHAAVGVPFVVVGGSAVERVVPVRTKDVDVLIEGSDWPAIDSALEYRRDASPLEPMSGTIRGTILTIGTASIDLKFLAGEPFSGRSDPETFVAYVRSHGSVVQGGVRYATSAFVFYMRLNPPEGDWRIYAPSIKRDIQSGVTPKTLDEAARIADRFGVGPEIRSRIQSLRTVLGSPADVPGE
ncbi:MAG: hypothetical protein WA688_05865 [Thermoplasmata archaeon]